MSLEEKINAAIKSAMLAREKDKLDALRAVKAALMLLKTEKDAKPITEEVEIKLLQKLVKQRKEAADIYQAQHRDDLYQEEMKQMEIIAQFLPAQLSKEEIAAALQQLAAEHNITSIKEMGKLMGLATQQFAGRADNKMVSQLVKELLS